MTQSIKLETGAILQGRYRLLECLGGGGMGQVWAAHHETLGHRVAVKVLHGNVMMEAEPRARFEREARLMAQLGESSRYITRVMEHGVLPDGTPYLVMECLRGEGLDARVKRERVLPLGVTVEIVTQLCRALTVAHAAGVVHRDIKPGNVFLCSDEDGKLLVKLLDFGVAKAMSETLGEQTSTGQVIGTPNYMSPEQVTQDVVVDHRADLFAVGAIAYRCSTGKTPFGKGSMSEMAMRILSATPQRPSILNPALPETFDHFIERALAKNPLDRFQSAREIADTFGVIVAELGTSAHLPVVLPLAADVSAPSLASSRTGTEMVKSTRPAAASAARAKQPGRGIAIGIAVTAMVAMAWLWFRPQAPSARAPAAEAPRAAPTAVASAAEAAPAATEAVAPPSASVAAIPSAASSANPTSASPTVVHRWAAPAAKAKDDDKAPPAVQDTWRKKDEM